MRPGWVEVGWRGGAASAAMLQPGAPHQPAPRLPALHSDVGFSRVKRNTFLSDIPLVGTFSW